MTTATSPVLKVTAAPYLHCGRTIPKVMRDHLFALLPAALLAVYFYGLDAAEVIAWAGLAAVAAEALSQKLMGLPSTADDYSALTAGVMFAFLLPATAPAWMVAFGAASGVLLGRMCFGGYGCSPVCAPVVGWAVLKVSWPDYMDINGMLLHWDKTHPLSELKYFGLEAVQDVSYGSLFLGEHLGALGAAQAGAILLGGLFLLARGHVRLWIPVAFLAGVFLTGQLYALIDPQSHPSALFHILTGSTLFAAFFLMPYPSASPMGRIPMVLYGLLGGALVIIIRAYGIYPDGVPFAVLLASLFTPLMDLIQPRPFGGR